MSEYCEHNIFLKESCPYCEIAALKAEVERLKEDANRFPTLAEFHNVQSRAESAEKHEQLNIRLLSEEQARHRETFYALKSAEATVEKVREWMEGTFIPNDSDEIELKAIIGEGKR